MSDEFLTQIRDEIIAGVVTALGGPPEDTRQLLTLDQVQERLQISDRTLRKLTNEEKVLPVISVGQGKGSLRVEPAALDAYLASRRGSADDDS